MECKTFSSFFDQNGGENSKFFDEIDNRSQTLKKKLFEGDFLTYNKKIKNYVTVSCTLYENWLSVKKQNKEKYLSLFNVRAEKVIEEKNKYHTLRLIKNRKDFNLLTQDYAALDAWMKELTPYCILSDFHKKYSNIKMIGKGSFARVYLVKRNQDSQEFAVKTFEKKNLEEKGAEKNKVALLNEIKIMRSLNHPYIIKLYEVFENERYIYLVLELLKGGELFDYIVNKGHYSEKDAVILIRKLLSNLDYLSSRGIMHRDLKPENLILKDNDDKLNVKFIDFGLATYINPKGEYLFRKCGTPGYVAPEILNDMYYDCKVDVFSIGVIFYILLTGCAPFYGESYNEILIKNKSCLVEYDFSSLEIEVSGKSMDLLKKMLAKNPSQRLTASEAMNHPVFEEEIVKELKEFGYPSTADNIKKYKEDRLNFLFRKNLEEQELHCKSPMMSRALNNYAQNKNLEATPSSGSHINSPFMTPGKGSNSPVIRQMPDYLIGRNVAKPSRFQKESTMKKEELKIDDVGEELEASTSLSNKIEALNSISKKPQPSIKKNQNPMSPILNQPNNKQTDDIQIALLLQLHQILSIVTKHCYDDIL